MSKTIKSVLKKSSSKTKKSAKFQSPPPPENFLDEEARKERIRNLVPFKKPSSKTKKKVTFKSPQKTPNKSQSVRRQKIRNLLQFKTPSKPNESLISNSNSYSPSINRSIRKNTKSRSKLSLYEEDSYNIESVNRSLKIPKINVYDKNNTKIVKKLNSAVVRKKMLKNLSSKKKINCNQIVMPNQILGNCWFNTFFVSFFISDKGKKFFKHLRVQMIKGRRLDGTLIEPSKLRRSLLLLNYYIELSTSNFLKSRTLAKDLNTNAIIYNIHNSLLNNEKVYVDINEAGNPLEYYETLINIINPDTFDIFKINLNTVLEINKLRTIEYHDLNNLYSINNVPNVIIVSVTDSHPHLWFNPCSMFNFKQINYNLTISGQKYKYKLDSVIIRDTKKLHWGSVFTCNKQYYGFDGASETRNNRFDWNIYLNQNIEWGFKGSNWLRNGQDTGNPIWWNFMSGAQLLLYFRV